MRAILILILIVVLLGVLGWFSFDVGHDRATIEVHRDQVRQDTADVAHRLEQAGREIKEETSELVQETKREWRNVDLDDADSDAPVLDDTTRRETAPVVP